MTIRNIKIVRLSIYAIAFALLTAGGCTKLVEVDTPANRISSSSVYSSDATATAVLTGILTKLSGNNYNGTPTIPSISMWAGLSADEFSVWSGATSTYMLFYKNALSANSAGGEFWQNIYPLIYACNAAIEGLNASTSLTVEVKQQLLGEAKFLRAFFYFHLVNLYGDVPLVISTDYQTNVSLARAPVAAVYQQIVADLRDAEVNLKDGYLKSDLLNFYVIGTEERVRPNKSAANALLARVYLYLGNWKEAEIQSTAVINNTAYYNLQSLNKVFLKNSNEAIWQLQPVTTGTISNTAEAVIYMFTYAPVGLNGSHPVYLSPSLIASFEPNDQRNTLGNWIQSYIEGSKTYYYPYKYKVAVSGTAKPTEYTMMLRLGEQYLIRAESRANQDNFQGALSDLNSVRVRAGLPTFNSASKPDIISKILHERQVELFTEFGHRWFDLKRTNTVDSVMKVITPLKGGTWNTDKKLYPISIPEILKGVNIVQNPGY